MLFLLAVYGVPVLLGIATVVCVALGMSAFCQVRGVQPAAAGCIGFVAGVLGPTGLALLVRALSPRYSTPWVLIVPAFVCALAWSIDQRSTLRRYRRQHGFGMAPDVPEHERGLW